MNEDSIFIMNVEHLLLRSRRKILLKTHLYCLFFRVCKFWRGEKKDENTAALTGVCVRWGERLLLPSLSRIFRSNSGSPSLSAIGFSI